MVNVSDSDIVISKFELYLCYYIHFQTNALRKGLCKHISFNSFKNEIIDKLISYISYILI